MLNFRDAGIIPVSILKSIAGRYRLVRVADVPIRARYRFIKNAYWDMYLNAMFNIWKLTYLQIKGLSGTIIFLFHTKT